MSEQSEALKERTMVFAIDVLRLVDRFPDTAGARVIAYQLAKCSTSVGATGESVYRLEIVKRIHLVDGSETSAVLQESIELGAIFSRSSGTARANARERRAQPPMTKSMPK